MLTAKLLELPMIFLAKHKQFLIMTGLCGLLVAAAGSYWIFGPRNAEKGDEFRTVRFINVQRPMTGAPIKPVRQAIKALNPDEMVLGVTIGKESRAYPLNMLNEWPSRKIINDTLGGKPIAVTWCDRCHSGIVFERQVAGQVLTFGISGDLWQDNMIMYDQETRSMWSQVLGEAKRGQFKGTRLNQVSSFLTDWRSWRSQYPLATVVVLDRSRQEFNREFYRAPERFVLAIAEGEKAKTWDLSDLSQRQVINDEWDGRPVLAVFDRASATARLFDRTCRGKVLSFHLEGKKLVDRATRTSWSPISGRAVSGPLLGRHLAPLPALVTYRTRWQQFHS
jgi:hypothetical protein